MGGGQPPGLLSRRPKCAREGEVSGRPDTEREDTWEAHQRITVRRAEAA
jgi:hypothetical protein